MSLPFTLDDIATAYEHTGMLPLNQIWVFCSELHRKKCGCPLAALVAHRLGFDAACTIGQHSDEMNEVALLLNIRALDVSSFTHGYDGFELELGEDIEVFNLGVEARERFKPVSFFDIGKGGES